MRLYIKTNKSNQVIDFNYQQLLTGCVHKWIGQQNNEHGGVSLYSFSWLQNVDASQNGIWLKDGSYFTINFYDTNLTKTVVKNILQDPEMFWGSRVIDIRIQETPEFSNKERFLLASPILIKRKDGEKIKHYTYADEGANDLMVETMKTKLNNAELDFGEFKIYFDKDFATPKTKIISYKNIKNKVSICPVIIEGSPELIAFAWDVGIGNSTGIGFGALK